MASLARRCGVLVVLVLLLSTGLAAMYWPFFEHPSNLKFFGYLDAWVYTGPVLFYGDRVLAAGELPTWNPYVYCGQPIAGNPQYLLFYPPNTLRSLLTPGPTPWNTNVGIDILLYLHTVWGALGAYALGRVHKLTRTAAIAAGLLFVFSAAYTQRVLLHHHLVMVVSWTPWTWLALYHLMSASSIRAALGWSVLLGITFGLAILAGSPQMTFLLGVSLALYWLISRAEDVFMQIRRRNGGSALHGLGRDLIFGAVAAALSIAVSAALVLPAYELIRQTPRAAADGQAIEIGLSFEKWSLSETLAIYPGSANHEGIKAIGASGLLLGLVGLFSAARREAILFAVLALLLFDASILRSRFMMDVIGVITPFPISSPGRTMMLTGLPLALLAGLGIDRLRTALQPRSARIAATALVLLVAAIFFEAAFRRMQALSESVPNPPYPQTFIGISAVTAIFLALALWLPGKRAFAAAAVCLAVIEPIAWRGAWAINATIGRGHFYRFGLNAATARPDFRPFLARQSVRYPNTSLYTLSPQINGYDPLSLHGFRELVAPHEEPVFFRGIIESQRRSLVPHLLLKRPFWLQREFVRGPFTGPNPIFAPTTTAYIEDPPELTVPEVAASAIARELTSSTVTRVALSNEIYEFHSEDGVVGTTHRLWIPPRDIHRHTILRLHVVGDCSAQLEVRLPAQITRNESEVLADVNLKPTGSEGIYLDVPLPDVEGSLVELQSFYTDAGDSLRIDHAELRIDDADEYHHLTIAELSAQTVEVELRDLPGPRILSFIDFNYPGWHAYLDDREVPILHAFSHFKGVEVPPGTHRVRFEFRPRIVPIGIAVSGGAFVLCLLLLAWAFRREPSRAFGVNSGA